MTWLSPYSSHAHASCPFPLVKPPAPVRVCCPYVPCMWATSAVASDPASQSLSILTPEWGRVRPEDYIPRPHWGFVSGKVTRAAMRPQLWWPSCIRGQLFTAPLSFLLLFLLTSISPSQGWACRLLNCPHCGPVYVSLLTNTNGSFSDCFDPAQICPCQQQGWQKKIGLSGLGLGELGSLYLPALRVMQMGIRVGPSDQVKSRFFTKCSECFDCNCSL